MSNTEPAGGPMVPLRQEVVEFYGDQLTGVLVPRPDGGATWCIPLRPLTAFLGLDWAGQFTRTKNDPVLGSVLIPVEIISTETPARGRGRRTLVCLPLEYLPGWLFGINAGKVRNPAIADKITRYRRECFRVLCKAFAPELLPPGDAPSVTPDLDQAEQALMLAEAVASLARSHMEQAGRIEVLEQRQATMADYLRPFVQRTNERLTALELRLSSGATISEDQAAEIALAVKNVAMLLTARGDVNGFGRVWGELYRRFRIGAYRNLPTARYQEALDWLQGWYAELSGAEEPPTDRSPHSVN